MDWHSRRIVAVLERALEEDHATRDYTTAYTIGPAQRASATILAKQECVLAGVGSIQAVIDVFTRLDGNVVGHAEVISHPEIFDGVRLQPGRQIAVIQHNARVILSCERVILNILQRMSGIATMTRRFVDAVAGTKAKILDTRKTVPGLRMMDKYAVHCGGGVNHRLDLSDGILIKNNHIALGGGITRVLTNALKNRRGKERIEIEVRSLGELEEALLHGAEAILLDNMKPEMVMEAVARVKKLDRWVPLECSGGITLENVRRYAEAGVDFISVGALTHSAPAVDLSMRISPA